MSKKKDKAAEAETTLNEAADGETISIATYPRARIAIRRTRTRAAVIAFVAVLALGLHAGQTPFDATWNALLAGIVVNIVAWRCAIIVWRHIVLAEISAAEVRYAARMSEVHDQLLARAAAQSDSVGFRAA